MDRPLSPSPLGSLTLEQAEIEYIEDTCTPEAIVDAIEAVGFEAKRAWTESHAAFAAERKSCCHCCW